MESLANTVQPDEEPEVEAHYALESAVRCNHCDQMLRTVHVVRLLRTKVNFTSSLSRRGHAVVCPSCRTFLPATIG